MATAFKVSAETLIAAEADSLSHRELPTCFLLRHAAELFLKSSLVVSHRFFTGSQDGVTVTVEGKSKPLTAVHGLLHLYSELIALLSRHQADLDTVSKTKWLPMPIELDEAIAAINEMDARGVFFRYPTEGNAKKSTNRPLSPEDISNWDKDKQGYLKAFLVLDQNDEIVEAFHYQPKSLTEELKILQTACYWLECIHVGLRMELAGGW